VVLGIHFSLRKELTRSITIFASYTLLTLVLTFPVAFMSGTSIPGDIKKSADPFGYLWLLWYARMSILNPKPGLTQFHTNYIFYPKGIPLIPLPTAFNELVSIPLQLAFGVQAAYTIVWLTGFVLGGYGSYLLVDYLTKSKSAAFICGIAYAFSPYHFAHAVGGHMGASTIQWIPFCALYLMKTFKEGGLKNAIYAGAFFILIWASDLQYMIFAGIFVGLLLAYEMWCKFEERSPITEVFLVLKKYVVFASVSLAGILPLTYNIMLTALSKSNILKPSIDQLIRYSADLLSFFVPAPIHPFFGEIVAPIYVIFTGNNAESTTYIGYTLLFACLIASLRSRRSKYVRFWIISSLLFTIFSMGPLLHVYGMTRFTVFGATIPLPYLILYYMVPFLENSRVASRFFVMATLSLTVLAGYGFCHILKNVPAKKRQFLSIFFALLLIFEFLSVPLPTSLLDRPSFYTMISQEKEDFALLEIAGTNTTSRYEAELRFAFYQTIHGKPIVGGQYSRIPQNAWDFQQNTPLIREFLPMWQRGCEQDILNQDVREVGESILNYYKIRYVILHREYMTEEEIQFASDLLRLTLRKQPVVYEDGQLVVYDVEKRPIGQFMTLVENWYPPQSWGVFSARWISDNATMLVYSPVDKAAILRFQVTSFCKPKTLRIYANEELVHEQEVSAEFNFGYVVVSMNLKRGENIVRFHSPGGCQRPCDVLGVENKDRRCLSFAFRNVTLANATR